MNVLIIGSGGREHCLAWKISHSRMAGHIYAAPGNAGMSDVAECIDIGINEFEALADFAVGHEVGLTVVGPEAPLVGGIADYFRKRGLDVFGPGKEGAQLEGSKVFTRNLAQKYGVPAAEGKVFSAEEYNEARQYIKSSKTYPLVLKADGLAFGKGVIIASGREQALDCLDDFFVGQKFGPAGNQIIVENFLTGYEVSLLCFYDGNNIVPLDLAQDYKRIKDNNQGKNTGGMGSYSPVPKVNQELMEKIMDSIIEPTCRGLQQEGIDYRGILYAGLMISEGRPYLLEYNCRFGDPETQAVLPRMEDDLLPWLLDCSQAKLKDTPIQWSDESCVCVVLASAGYPETSSKGDIIKGLEKLAETSNIMVFHAGTAFHQNHLVTDGGRVLGVVGKAASFEQARQNIYAAIKNIDFRGKQFRKDIALNVGR
ncbi:MAG: phosphoribosylamine--glycine ligase [Actinomycetota bacterium]|nr:phosphoribosylamine--glycine ligase [Actinomycetota bacterium]